MEEPDNRFLSSWVATGRGTPVLRFAEQEALNFPVLSDPTLEVHRAYSAFGEKSLYGKKSIGIKRTTFLIGPDGTILHVFKRPKTDRHAEEILAKLPV